jgi:hypothetical protein
MKNRNVDTTTIKSFRIKTPPLIRAVFLPVKSPTSIIFLVAKIFVPNSDIKYKIWIMAKTNINSEKPCLDKLFAKKGKISKGAT